MKKPIIILSGVYFIIIGLLQTFSIYVSIQNPIDPSMAVDYGYLFVVIPIAVCMLSSGIGLIVMNNWARISVLIISGVSIILGLLFIVATIYTPETILQTEAGAMSLDQAKPIFLTSLTIFFIAMPLFFIFFFTARSVKAVFVNETTSQWGEGVPLGVKIVSFIYMFSIFGLLGNLALPLDMEYQLLGSIIVSGVPMKITVLIMTALQVYIAFGLFKLRQSAWTFFMVFTSATLGLSVFNILTMNNAIFGRVVPYLGDINLTLENYRVYALLGLILPVGLLMYIYKRKGVFVN